MITEEAAVLRIYLNDDDRFEGRPLYEAIIARARTLGLAGASAFRGEAGFGAHRAIHDAASEYAFIGSPVVIEVVDAPGRVAALASELAGMIRDHLVTIGAASSPARIVRTGPPAA
jgi:PII-like signaling protein